MGFSYDVVVMGGAFSGASMALLLKRDRPATRILIIEKTREFDRKVGESTTEVSSCFLTKVLGISTWLGHHQLAKQGLRMWFARTSEEKFEDCAEVGAQYNARLAGFQIDRSTLDEYLLSLAVAEGCELWRPAKVTGIDLGGVGRNIVTVKMDGEELPRSVGAQWVVDASGRAATIARKMGVLCAMTELPTNALWARFSGVKDWDGVEIRSRYPSWAGAVTASRSWATNHLMGLGWWVWIIPLKGGDYSVGLVYDTRLFAPPDGATIGDRLIAHLATHPIGREIFGEARPHQGDQRAYANLPYVSERVHGDGWAIVGDAAGFIDPLYSPGLDFCSFTAQGAKCLILKALGGEAVEGCIADYNAAFAFSYRAWFEGIYRDKYYYVGDAELMSVAFLLDVALYHLGPVRQVYADPAAQFARLPFEGNAGRAVGFFMGFYNRRLANLARRKLRAGVYGARNAHFRLLVGGFLPDGTSGRLLFRGLILWGIAEWRNLFLIFPCER